MTVIRAVDLRLDYPLFDAADYSLKRAVLRLMRMRRDPRKTFRAIDDLTFDIASGERIGLYGPNGSGKSSLLRLLAGIYPPSSGRLVVEGHTTAILGLGAGSNPEMSAEANIRMLLRLDGIAPNQQLSDQIWRFTEIPDQFRTMPLKSFSSGMQMRVLFAVTTCAPVDILLLDEWLSVMDETFQEKAEATMHALAASSRIMIIASHNLPLLRRVCTSIWHMGHGAVTKIEPCAAEAPADPEPPRALAGRRRTRAQSGPIDHDVL
jgi:lipopolysaccharide transport system ATP-binding protein